MCIFNREMWGVTVSIISGLMYWLLEENIVTYRFGKHHSKTLAVLKWITIVGLIVEHLSLHYHALYERLMHIIHKSFILLFYGIGDIVIVFDQNYSIAFFMCGHILMLIECALKMIVLAVEYTVCITVFSILCTGVSTYLFKQHNKNITDKVLRLYILYIFVLSLILITPLVTQGYIGGWFFVISDLLLGFQIKRLSKLTFPLYYTSLLCLLYLYTTHE